MGTGLFDKILNIIGGMHSQANNSVRSSSNNLKVIKTNSHKNFKSNYEMMRIGNVEVQIIRKPRRRNMSLAVYHDKPIRITTNVGTSKADIEKFVLSKHDWILKHLNKFETLKQKFPEKKLIVGEKYPFLGLEKKFTVSLTPLKKAFVALQVDCLHLYLPQNIWSSKVIEKTHLEYKHLLNEFYKREAIKYIGQRVMYWSEQMNLKPKAISFRNQSTRWGSCSSQGKISLNYKLMVFAPEVIDYVVIHELAHLKYLNHSNLFWQLVEEHCPEYLIHEKTLKSSHHEADFLSR